LNPEHAVFWWDNDGVLYKDAARVDAETAVNRAYTLIHGPASALGIVARVIITDSGDCTNFEWIRGQGITYKGEPA
jgi:hypothetical protein